MFVYPCLWSLCAMLRRAGIPIVFMSHNVLDHERRSWNAFLSTSILRLGSLHLVHNGCEIERLRALLPDADVRAHRHPIYDHYPAAQTRLPRRAGLELLFYGFIRTYKGLPVLLEAIGLLRDIDLRLTVVGEFWTGEKAARELIDRLGIGAKIELVPRYVSEIETAAYFDRADAVVLPYLVATGSGVATVAYHYDKPVIATDTGGLSDYVLEGRTGLLTRPADASALAEAIRRFNASNRDAWAPAIRDFKQTFSGESMARTILDAARDLRSKTAAE